MTRPDPLTAVVVGLGVAMVAVTVPGCPAALRAAVAAAFFLAAPGLAWLRLLPVEGPVEAVAAVVGLSLAVDLLVAQVLLHLGRLDLAPVLAALLLVSAAGTVLTSRRRDRAPA